MNVKGYIKQIIVEYPYLYKLLTFKLGVIKNKGKRNVIKNKSLSLSGSSITIKGNDNIVILESGCVLNKVLISIKGNNHILRIGKNVRIFEGGGIRFEDTFNRIDIDEYTTIQSANIVASDSQNFIKIGCDCLFSSNIVIRTSDGHSIIDAKSGNRINKSKSVFIGNHVWLGHGVNVLKGAYIGNNVVIGTHSIVTKTVEESCLAVGNPARIVRKDINWDRKRLNNYV